jgi:hypothetical protein
MKLRIYVSIQNISNVLNFENQNSSVGLHIDFFRQIRTRIITRNDVSFNGKLNIESLFFLIDVEFSQFFDYRSFLENDFFTLSLVDASFTESGFLIFLYF